MSTSPSGCSISRQRIASGIRLRSSGVMRRPRGFGHHPEHRAAIEALRAAFQRVAPERAEREGMGQRHVLAGCRRARHRHGAPGATRPAARSCSSSSPAASAPPPRAPGRAAGEQLGGHQRVTRRAMAGGILEGKESVRASSDRRWRRHQPAGQPNGAQPRRRRGAGPAPGAPRRRRIPSRSGRCGRRRLCPDSASSTRRQTSSNRGAARTMSSVMPVIALMIGEWAARD